ncbi:MAG: VirB4-like conjugal transfer ATPase, CD1110 family [Patescibacteria group bacterium]
MQKPKYDLEKYKELFENGADMVDILAPEAIEIDFNHVQISSKYYRTLFVSGYPRFVSANWLGPIINFDHSLNISFYYYPASSQETLLDLRRKIAEMEATLQSDVERGRVEDPSVRAALEDAKDLQEHLTKGMERFFRFSFYITIPADSEEELDKVTSQVLGTLRSLMIIAKKATLRMEDGFKSVLPAGNDHLNITRNMDTTSLATTFPFVSSELTANEGILYGINEHNGSLIIFDRFSLENANEVIFGKSGSGKSFLAKLEVMRSLMFGNEVIIIDPEQEYRPLCEAYGGDYISFSLDSPQKINPFDLGIEAEDDVNRLGSKILSLHRFFRIALGDLSSEEEAVLDKALMSVYRLRGITADPDTQDEEPPLMEDLYKVLMGMEERAAQGLADRLERYIKGSLAGIFDQRSTLDLNGDLTVFSTRDLEDKLRPIAMYMILDFIWNRIRSDLRRRFLLVDEAWYLMRYKDSAEFLYSIAKRARKYYLGLTAITQDTDDFLESGFGKAIIDNSSIAILMKQHPAAIDQVGDVFYLSEGEKRRLLSASVGEGLFFAGANHVAMRVVASDAEYELATSKPEDILEREKEQDEEEVVEGAVSGEEPPREEKGAGKARTKSDDLEPTEKEVTKEEDEEAKDSADRKRKFPGRYPSGAKIQEEAGD